MSFLIDESGITLNLNNIPICGRKAEIDTLNRAFQALIHSNQCVIIQGVSGCGKSSLVDSQRSAWTAEKKCLFASSKFAFEKSRSDPFSTIIGVLNELVSNWLSCNEGRQAEIENFAQTLDEPVFRRFMPRLFEVANILVQQPSPKDDGSVSTQTSSDNPMREYNRFGFDQLKVAISKLLSAVCQPTRPVVIFLDDIQWADMPSIDILNLFATVQQTMVKGLLLIVSYREEEVEDGDPVSVLLRNMEQTDSQVNVHRIVLRHLPLVGVNQLVSRAIGRDYEDTLSLSTVVLEKTDGNPYTVLQFLGLLQEKKFLEYSLSSCKWEWHDVSIIRAETKLSDDVADIVAAKMRRLPRDFQCCLMVAAALGTYVPTSILVEFFKERPILREGNDVGDWIHVDPDSLGSILEHLSALSILSGSGTVTSNSEYRWGHDKLRQAAYSLIPDAQRELLHYQLGKLLSSIFSSSSGEEWIAFLAARQLSQGSSLISTKESRVEVARLNLQAGLMCISKAAYYPAADMLREGIEHLDAETRWLDTYDTCLDLFNGLAQMEFLKGNRTSSMNAVQEILEHARSLEDKYIAHPIFLDLELSLVDSDYGHVVDRCLEVLSLYGEHIPRNPSSVRILSELISLFSSLPKKRLSGLLLLPIMSDEKAIKVTRLIVHQLVIAVMHSTEFEKLRIMIGIRLLRIACQYGLCPEIAVALFAAAIICRYKGRYKRACELGSLAVKIADRFTDGQWHLASMKVRAMAHGSVLPTLRPFHQSLDHFSKFQQQSLIAGRISDSVQAAIIYSLCYLCVGLPLDPLEKDLMSFSQEFHQFGQPDAYLVQLSILHQAVLNLLASSENPSVLAGSAMNQEESVHAFAGEARMTIISDMYPFRLMLACIYQDFNSAKDLMDTRYIESPNDLQYYRVHIRLTYTGLLAFALGRKTKIQKYSRIGRNILKHFTAAVKQGSVNSLPVMLMLKAEASPSKGRYDEAIKACGRSGFSHHQALMNERAGLFFLDEAKDEGWAEFYLLQAMELYHDWGAVGKVISMKQQHNFLARASREKRFSTSSKGRSRHNTLLVSQLQSFSLSSSDK